jgi:Domain of unknown function (DUF3854)
VEAEYHKSKTSKPPNHLAERHRSEIEEGSAIAPEIRAGRGYKTVTAAEARSVGFSGEQAGDGLLIPFYTPWGEMSYQLKPDKPRPKAKGEGKGEPIKYETRARHDIVLDVHPTHYERLLFGNDPIWVLEGIKKSDCLASLHRLAVGLSGVWNWGRKRKRGGAKYGRPQLLPDWDAIPLEGRIIYICFDADYRQKQSVALAMLRLAERLTERGVHVYIADLPGPEKGIDDFVVAGGDVDELQRAARPFTPSDLIRYAAKKDERVRRVVGRIAGAMRLDEWVGWDSTAHSLLRTLLELALLGGRYDKDTGTVEILIGTRELCQYASIGCRKTLTKHTAKLEERGYIKKVAGDHKKGRANRYILKLSNLPPGIEVMETSYPLSISGGRLDNLTYGESPHLRWPAFGTAALGDERDSKLPREGASPENPSNLKPVLDSVYHEEESPEVHVEPEVSLGKTVELALHLLLSWGGEATLGDLSTASGVNHTTKMRAKLEAVGGVFDLDPKGKHGARVRLAEDWRTRLDDRRDSSGELRRSRQQAVKLRQAKEAFRNDAKTDPEPDLAGPEKMADTRARANGRAREARLDEQRRKVGMTAETFLADALQDAAGFGWRELRALWMAKGGEPEGLRRAVREPYEFRREYDGGPLYVIRGGAVPEHEPAPVVVLREPEPKMPEKGPDGVDHHDAFCDCDWCAYDYQPSYAKPWGGR